MDVPSKVTTSQYLATEFMQILNELENSITDSGQSLSSGDVFQISKAMSIYGSGADFYIDSGAADAYILSIIGSKKAPAAYFNGMRIRFRTSNANTGASTVNVASLGVKNIKLADGSTDPSAGDIGTASDTEAVYDGTSFRLLNIQFERLSVSQSIAIAATKRLYFDGGSNTYISETAANIIGITTDTIERIQIAAAGLTILPTAKLYLDGSLSGNTYISESSADTISFFAGGNEELKINGTTITVPSNNLAVSAGSISATGGNIGVFTSGLGFFVGAALDAQRISDQSAGASSTTLYIGNASIDVTPCDEKYKKNIVVTKLDALSLVNQFEIKDWAWKDDDKENRKGTFTGLVAQDLESIYPQAVIIPKNREDNGWSVRYNYLVPILIKAIQQLDAKIA